MQAFKKMLTKFWNDEEGIQTLEILLIIAVIVFIALLFREHIADWINDLVDVGDDEIKKFESDPT